MTISVLSPFSCFSYHRISCTGYKIAQCFPSKPLLTTQNPMRPWYVDSNPFATRESVHILWHRNNFCKKKGIASELSWQCLLRLPWITAQDHQCHQPGIQAAFDKSLEPEYIYLHIRKLCTTKYSKFLRIFPGPVSHVGDKHVIVCISCTGGLKCKDYCKTTT